MPKPLALVTNALVFAGSPAITALQQAGLQVAAHDLSFATAHGRESYQKAHPEVVVLQAQEPDEVVESAWQIAKRLDVLVSNDAFHPVQGPIENAELTDLRATLERLVVFPFALARAAIPRLKERPGARVVLVTSNRNRLPLAGGAIPVNAVAPNYLYSETYYPRARFVDDAAGRTYIERTVPAGRLAEPAEIGELIAYLATMKG